jgi:acetolactate synthase I/II/III large subunit
MAIVNGAQLVARALALAGVGPIFTLSGNQILPIYEAGLDAGLRFVDTRHESAAAHMADAWGRVTGRPGICLVTAGPGHTNALTGLATAWMADSPMILLSGGSNVAQAGMGGFQELDQVAVAKPICKRAWLAGAIDAVPGMIARAHRMALEGLPGPIHVTLPFDVLHDTVEESEVRQLAPADFEPQPIPAEDRAIDEAVALLGEARRPILLATSSVWRGEAAERLRAFSEETGIPAFPIESPRGLTDPTLHGLGALFKRADAVLLFGPQDFTIGFAGPRAFGDARLIQVMPTSDLVARNRPVDVALVGDARTVLGQLLDASAGRAWQTSAWRDELEAARAEHERAMAPHATGDAAPIHPLRAARAVVDLLRPGDCVALDGGEFGQWARWAVGTGPYERIGNGKLGGIGGGIPFAIAAKLAKPEARSVAFIGDGTFGFHGLELDTAVRFKVPMVAVVGNDAGWAAERHRQREVYGPDRLVAADLLPTRYDRVCAALGGHGEHVERPEELRPALERAFASGTPAVVNVAIASIPSPSAAAH